MTNKFTAFFYLFFGLSGIAHKTISQLAISPGSTISTSPGLIALSCDLFNNSELLDLNNADITLTGNDQVLRTSSALSLKSFKADGSGEKKMHGTWEVIDQLLLFDGIVKPAKGVDVGTFIYEGDKPVESSQTSYVNGIFYSKGKGQRFFPVGNDVGYYPAVLAGSTSLVGIEVIESDPLVQPPVEQSITASYDQRYWKLVKVDNGILNSVIGLSLNGTESFTTASVENPFGLVVLEGQSGSAAVNLGQNSISPFFVFSNLSVSGIDAIYTIGKTTEVNVKVRSIITPNNDLINDRLHIEYIDLFPDNKVVLMDRWGARIKEWTNFSNTNTSFDYASLPEGHYVCMVNYKTQAGEIKLSQMVSVLK